MQVSLDSEGGKRFGGGGRLSNLYIYLFQGISQQTWMFAYFFIKKRTNSTVLQQKTVKNKRKKKQIYINVNDIFTD